MTDLSDEAIRAYAANIFDLEDARENAQSDLKDAWAHIREAHGKRFADSLKLAVKRARMDHDKRAAGDEVDAEAERIFGILSHVARGARTREDIPEHDAETGEVIESTAARKDVPGLTTDATQGSSLPVVARNLEATPGSPGAPNQTAGTQAPPVDTIPEPLPRTHSDLRGAASREDAEAAAPEPSNVTPFRTHNPDKHFLNSKGLPRLHGCSNPEACAGSHRALCGSCAKAAEGSAA